MSYLEYLDTKERTDAERIQRLIDLIDEALMKLQSLKKECNNFL